MLWTHRPLSRDRRPDLHSVNFHEVVTATQAKKLPFDERVALLYERHASSATRYAIVLTGNEEIARDVVQEAFTRVLGRFRRTRQEPDVLDVYIRRTILNIWRSHLRRKQLERRHLPSTSSGEDATTTDLESRDQILRLLMILSPRERAAVFLRYYQDRSIAQIAQEFDCSHGAVRSILMRALNKLRNDWEVFDVH